MPLLFLNERSWRTACDPARAERAMADFVEAVRAAAKEDPADTSLVSEVELKSLEIAEGYPIGKWIGGSPKNHVRWQRLLALRSRSPVRSVFPTPDADGHLEYRYEGEEVLGLGAAHFMDGIAVSLPVAHAWQRPAVTVERTELVELDDESMEFEQETVDVRHISAPQHVDDHLTWIRESGLSRAATGRQIWERKADLYPHLQFLPRTEVQLDDLDPRWVVPVRRCLERLDAAAATWDPATTHEPVWQTKVTPEGETRKRVCRFEDLDGKTRTFHLHARFTPGAGRIHLRPVGENGKVRIAHIGSKIRPDL
ncbi:hypothetical protein [Streptomyces caniscabiei]|uniref:hypothetical protein n=1 Tax=Streptomyces caniscabiei TaxID=2746961 RepID=UPI00117DFFB9|nr:hypothetical protein [Streptomyces caniscabiei]MBD9703212.1 hypothetical protein [Streptomyces caniscabiei]MDX3732847.1 hypothetical protein [Streptomyces caniscabiei]